MESDLLKTSIGGIVRHLVTTAGGALASGGIIADSDVATLVGAVMALFGIAWSIVQKRIAAQKSAGVTLSAHPFAVILAVILVLPLLTACESMFPQMAPIMGAADGTGEEEAADATAPQRLGDRLFGTAGSLAVRQARQELAVGAYFYLLQDRVTRYDQAIAEEALGRMQALRGTLSGRWAELSGSYPETLLGEATIELARIAVDTGYERATRLAGLFAGGFNVEGLLLRGRVAARQAFFVDLLFNDIRGGVVAMNADPATIEGKRADALLMMCLSENAVRGLLKSPLLDCSAAPESA